MGTGKKTTDSEADITTRKFDKAEAAVLKNINSKEYLDSIWKELDYNGNRKVSLAEIDKMCSSIRTGKFATTNPRSCARTSGAQAGRGEAMAMPISRKRNSKIC